MEPLKLAARARPHKKLSGLREGAGITHQCPCSAHARRKVTSSGRSRAIPPNPLQVASGPENLDLEVSVFLGLDECLDAVFERI